MRLNVLALSYLFPNRAQPAYGIFVFNRLKAIQNFCNIKVIAPIQWYPLIHRVRGVLWGANIPLRDEFGGMEVYHPRFPVIPRYLKWIDAVTYFLAARSVVKNLKIRESFEFDLVDVHWTYPDIVAGYILARKYDRRFIVTVRGHEALYLGENTLRRRMVTYLLRKADFVITLSDELRSLVLNLGIAPEKASVILNGVDLSRFHPLDRDACRQQLDLPTRSKIIISVGRLTEGKGHHELVRIMPDISKAEDVQLYIIGGVNPEDDFSHVLRAMITNLKLKNVHLIEQVEHEMLPSWYNAADLFCLATKREGCPNVVLEALSCGTPVVVTDVGAVSQMVVRGKNGYLVRFDELTSLGEIIRLSLNQKWNRQEIAANMQNRGWSFCAEQAVDIYRSVLGSR